MAVLLLMVKYHNIIITYLTNEFHSCKLCTEERCPCKKEVNSGDTVTKLCECYSSNFFTCLSVINNADIQNMNILSTRPIMLAPAISGIKYFRALST